MIKLSTPLATKNDINTIVSSTTLSNLWSSMDTYVYYLRGEPYGLICQIQGADKVFIASTTTHYSHHFTKAMMKDFMKLNKHDTICLITDHKPSQGHMRKMLSRYGATFEVKDDILYSTIQQNKG